MGNRQNKINVFAIGGLVAVLATCVTLSGCGGSEPAAPSAGVEERTAPVGQVEVAEEVVDSGPAEVDASAAQPPADEVADGIDVGEIEAALESDGYVEVVEMEFTEVEEPAQPPAAEGAAPADPGKVTYDDACGLCHDSGAAGAPKTGDVEAWAPRIAQGMEVVNDNAVNGFQGPAGIMPPKGGRTDLNDDDVRAAVAYMVANSQ